MSVNLNIDNASFELTKKRFNDVREWYPKEAFKAIVNIMFDIKAMAQRKLKEDSHIITSRLRNSIYVQARDRRRTSRGDNRETYSDNPAKGDQQTYNAKLNISLSDEEVAVGTNVEYAQKIEDIDSYLYDSAQNVNTDKWFSKIPDVPKK